MEGELTQQVVERMGSKILLFKITCSSLIGACIFDIRRLVTSILDVN